MERTLHDKHETDRMLYVTGELTRLAKAPALPVFRPRPPRRRSNQPEDSVKYVRPPIPPSFPPPISHLH